MFSHVARRFNRALSDSTSRDHSKMPRPGAALATVTRAPRIVTSVVRAQQVAGA
jgi:hypothetical protein